LADSPGRTTSTRAGSRFYTFGLILSITRGIAAAHHALRYTDQFTGQPTADVSSRCDPAASGLLIPEPRSTFFKVQSCRANIRIIGFRGTGEEIARLAGGVGIRIFVHDPFASESIVDTNGAQRVALLDLAASSDIVTVGAKVTPETRGLI
jgi:lactate dehydrogenase-like 2-hydroxyacid dehydrogenase